MPQFDLSTFPSQMFWLAIIFALQYFLIAKFVVPAFKVLFSKRARHLKKQLNEAEILSKKSESLRLDYEQKLEELKQKHAALFKKASEEIESTSQNKLFELEKIFLSESNLHQKDSEANQKQIEKEIDDASLELASDMILKLTNINVNKSKLIKYMN